MLVAWTVSPNPPQGDGRRKRGHELLTSITWRTQALTCRKRGLTMRRGEGIMLKGRSAGSEGAGTALEMGTFYFSAPFGRKRFGEKVECPHFRSLRRENHGNASAQGVAACLRPLRGWGTPCRGGALRGLGHRRGRGDVHPLGVAARSRVDVHIVRHERELPFDRRREDVEDDPLERAPYEPWRTTLFSEGRHPLDFREHAENQP